MMIDCKNGKIDLVLAKSISRFGRDVGGFNILTISDSIIDQYATLAQTESQSHSEREAKGSPGSKDIEFFHLLYRSLILVFGRKISLLYPQDMVLF